MASSSPFIARGVKVSDRVFDEELIKYKKVDSIAEPEKFDKNKPELFLTETKIVEYERTPIREFVQSFVSKVGLKNELKGIISKQQMDEFIQEHQATGGFVDLTKLPDSAFGMQELAKNVDAYWDEVPAELKEGLTKEEFLKSISSEKVMKYIQDKASAIEEANKKKEGEE